MFKLDGKFYAMLLKISEVVVLNFWFIICSLPVVTLGASFSAMYAVAMHTLRGVGDESATKEFFRYFRENFAKATILWLINLAVYVVIVLDHYILTGTMLFFKEDGIHIGQILLLIVFIVNTFVFLFSQTLQSTFENTIVNTLKNALLIAMKNAPVALFMAAVMLSPLWCTLLMPQQLSAWILFGAFFWFSGTAYVNAYFLNRIFNEYMPEKPENNNENSDGEPEEGAQKGHK